jgi:hypothetical protein
MTGDFADDPLGGGAVEVEVGVAREHSIEECEVFGPAAHVCGDPGHGEAVEHAFKADVVIALGAIDARVCVLG